jgi:hypothetical protein
VLYEAVRDHLATLLSDIFACPHCGGRRRVLPRRTSPLLPPTSEASLGSGVPTGAAWPGRGPGARLWWLPAATLLPCCAPGRTPPKGL